MEGFGLYCGGSGEISNFRHYKNMPNGDSYCIFIKIKLLSSDIILHNTSACHIYVLRSNQAKQLIHS